jgi:hypothetical protein
MNRHNPNTSYGGLVEGLSIDEYRLTAKGIEIKKQLGGLNNE